MGFLGEYEALSSADAGRALLFQWLNQRRHELYAELRENAPVFSTPDFFLVTHYQDAKTIIEDGDRFVETRLIPVVMMTALGAQEDRIREAKPEPLIFSPNL
jgi:cytochrome P450